MKYKFLFFLFILSFYISNSYSQTIAYANFDKIVKTSIVGKKIITYFSEKNEKMMKEIKSKESKIIESEKSLLSQKNILEADEYKKKVDSIKIEINEFNNYRKKELKIFKSEKDAVTKAFIYEINKILKDYAELNKIDIIFSSKHLLIGKSSLDLTENILKDVNKKITKFKINE